MSRKLALLIVAVAAALIAWGSYALFAPPKVVYAQKGELPENVREAFAKARSLELYSLDPSTGDKEGQGFRGWTVLGKVTLKDAAAKSAMEAVEQGVKDSDGRGAKCFIPRHGMRVGSVDLVICFECSHVYVYEGRNRAFSHTTEAPARVLNKLLGDAGIPLPAPPK